MVNIDEVLAPFSPNSPFTKKLTVKDEKEIKDIIYTLKWLIKNYNDPRDEEMMLRFGSISVTNPDNIWIALSWLNCGTDCHDEKVHSCFYFESIKTFWGTFAKENLQFSIDITKGYFGFSDKKQFHFNGAEEVLTCRGTCDAIPVELKNSYDKWVENGKQGYMLKSNYPSYLEILKTKSSLRSC